MNIDQLKEYYEAFALPFVMDVYESDAIPDIPARREAWNNMMDGLEREGSITEEQAFDDAGLPDCYEGI